MRASNRAELIRVKSYRMAKMAGNREKEYFLEYLRRVGVAIMDDIRNNVVVFLRVDGCRTDG